MALSLKELQKEVAESRQLKRDDYLTLVLQKERKSMLPSAMMVLGRRGERHTIA